MLVPGARGDIIYTAQLRKSCSRSDFSVSASTRVKLGSDEIGLSLSKHTRFIHLGIGNKLTSWNERTVRNETFCYRKIFNNCVV